MDCLAVMLATHANAFLAGHPVKLEMSESAGRSREWRFRIENDMFSRFATDPGGWFRWLADHGHVRSRIVVEDLTGPKPFSLHDFNWPAPRGAPLTEKADNEMVWCISHATEKFEDGSKVNRTYIGGYILDPRVTCLQATVTEAEEEFSEMLQQMDAFQRIHAPERHSYEPYDEALAVLNGSIPIPEALTTMLPSGLYPESSYRLIGALHRVPFVGGLGYWNDIFSADPIVQSKYADLAHRFSRAGDKALFAACDVDLR